MQDERENLTRKLNIETAILGRFPNYAKQFSQKFHTLIYQKIGLEAEHCDNKIFLTAERVLK